MIFSFKRLQVQGKLSKLRGQMSRFHSGFRWLLVSLWRTNPVLTVLIVVAAGTGVLVSAISIFIVFALLNSLETGQGFRVIGRLVSFSEYPSVQVGASAVAGMLIGFSMIYWSKLKSVGLAGCFHLYCANRVLGSFGGNLGPNFDYGKRANIQTAVYKLIAADCRQASMAVRRFLQGVVPALIVFPGFAVLFIIDSTTTFLVVGLVLIASPVFYLVNVGATRATREFEDLNPDVRDYGLSVIRDSAFSDVQPVSSENDPFVRSVDAFRRRFGSLVHAEFVSQIVMVLAMGILFASLGRAALDGSVGWSLVAAYLVALRFSMNSFRQLFQVVATFSRLFPAIHRLDYFFKSIPPSGRVGSTNWEYSFLVQRGGVFQKRRLLRLAPKQVVNLVSCVELSRYSAHYFASLFAGRGATDACLAQMLIVNESDNNLYVSGVGGFSVKISLDDANWEGDLRPIVQRKLVFVEASTLASISGLMKALNHETCHNVFVVSRTLESGRKYYPDLQVAADSHGKIVAAGAPDLLASRIDEIDGLMGRERPSQGSTNKGSDEELSSLEDF